MSRFRQVLLVTRIALVIGFCAWAIWFRHQPQGPNAIPVEDQPLPESTDQMHSGLIELRRTQVEALKALRETPTEELTEDEWNRIAGEMDERLREIPKNRPALPEKYLTLLETYREAAGSLLETTWREIESDPDLIKLLRTRPVPLDQLPESLRAELGRVIVAQSALDESVLQAIKDPGP